jgi:hypothetical protein
MSNILFCHGITTLKRNIELTLAHIRMTYTTTEKTYSTTQYNQYSQY